MTPPAPVRDTMPSPTTIAGILADLLERETTLVRATKLTEIGPLQPEKIRLTLLFQKTLEKSGKPVGKAWTAAAERLAQAAIDNERALRVGRAATDRLIATVISAVRKSRGPATTYVAKRCQTREARMAGITLDRKL
jgi:hypothetical protein